MNGLICIAVLCFAIAIDLFFGWRELKTAPTDNFAGSLNCTRFSAPSVEAMDGRNEYRERGPVNTKGCNYDRPTAPAKPIVRVIECKPASSL